MQNFMSVFSEMLTYQEYNATSLAGKKKKKKKKNL